MGRYGNVFLVNGETDLTLPAQAGEVVRFYIVNTANSRVFNLAIPGGSMKLVGGDSGRVEHEALVDSVILAPSERVVVDVHFESAGEYLLEHQTPERSIRLARLVVDETAARNDTHDQYSALRSAPELEAERAAIASYLSAAPDKTLALIAEMDLGADVEIGTLCACPMHADIVATWADQCPRCGMKLLPAAEAAAELMTLACPMHPDVTASWEATCPKCGMTLRPPAGSDDPGVHDHHAGHDISSHAEHGGSGDHDAVDDHSAHHADGHDHGHEHGHSAGHGHETAHSHGHGSGDGIEWEDDMLEVNRTTTTANTHWKIVDRDTGAAGHAISWKFRVGDRVKIRIVNEPDSDHPMHHPFHIHGAGRFLVLARDGVTQENFVWKDTVLLRMGETVDILLDVTNPGRWMAHCHIAEHHESGMMFSFDVVERNGSSPEAQ
jgi:FtsP/CotA-like multicopper oxidase with cupredoxin domain